MNILDEDKSSLGREEYVLLSEKISYKELEVENPEILEVVTKLDDVADNGEAILKRFKIRDNEGVFDYIKSMPNSSMYGFIRNSLPDFLTSKEINRVIDGLNTEEGFSFSYWRGENKEESKIDWSKDYWYHPVFIDGYIAYLLIRGGAYTTDKYKGHYSEAKDLGKQFDQEIIDGNYEEFTAWRIQETQWSDWFQGVPHWDDTLILFDKKSKEIWLLMFTSTD